MTPDVIPLNYNHITQHKLEPRENRRHLEHLHNRGRQNNIRVRGLPEAEGAEDLQLILESVFNLLLGEPVSQKISSVLLWTFHL